MRDGVPLVACSFLENRLRARRLAQRGMMMRIRYITRILVFGEPRHLASLVPCVWVSYSGIGVLGVDQVWP